MAAAAAPNSTSIGGAGTSVGGPPEVLVEVEVEPPVEVEVDDEVEDEVDDEVELDVELEVELLVEDDEDVDEEVLLEVETLPELVEVELEVETFPELVETLPELVDVELEVETLPELVETLPELVEVEVEMLPELVELELPPELVLVLPPDELDEPPEVLVEPVLVEVITTLPPEELPPPKNPPKKPPPNPPPQPPPMTTGVPPPPPVCGGSGGSIGIAAMAICGAGSQVVVVRVMTRRMRFTLRGAAAMRWARWGMTRLSRGAATLACFTYCGFVVLGASATCTAPPPSNAPPAAVAASFTMAVRTDIILSLVIAGAGAIAWRKNPAAIDCPALRNAESACYDNCVNRVWRRVFAVSCPAAGQWREPVPQWHRMRRTVDPIPTRRGRTARPGRPWAAPARGAASRDR